MSDHITTSWPIFVGGALVISCFILKRNINEQAKSIDKLTKENDQLKAEIDKLTSFKLKIKEQTTESDNNIAQLQRDLEALRRQKEALERSLASLRKQEADWEHLRSQIVTENTNLKLDNSNLRDSLVKLQKLVEENNQLKSQLSEKERTSKDALDQIHSKLDHFQREYQRSENQRINDIRLSSHEADTLKDKVKQLEYSLIEYKALLQKERQKFQELEKQQPKLEPPQTPRSETSADESQDQSAEDDEMPPGYSSKSEEGQLPPPAYSEENKQQEDEESDTPRSKTSESSDDTPPAYFPQKSLLKEPESGRGSLKLDEKDFEDLTNKLNLPDAAHDFTSPKTAVPSAHDLDFDLTQFKKLNKRKETKPVVEDDDTQFDISAFKKKEKKPAFMSIFMSPQEIQTIKDSRQPWQQGNDVVRDFGVKEDANTKGAKKSKRRGGVAFGSTKVHDMEDTHYMEFPFMGSKSRALYCVFDGHGGQDCAMAAKALFSKELENQINATGISDDMSSVLQTTFLNVDKQLEQYEYMGCTATAVFIWEFNGTRYVQAANVGDSTAFLKRKETVLWLTRDHKASSQEERDRITSAGGELTSGQTRVMGGLAVSRALGDHFLKMEKVGLIADPYISPSIAIDNDDTTIVMASDGLWDVTTGEDAMNQIQHLADAEAAARQLVSNATSTSKCTDNITVIVVYL